MNPDVQTVFVAQSAAERMAAYRYAYLMQWAGGAFPQNGAIGVQLVGSIHGGVVRSKEGVRLGICEWLISFDNNAVRQLVIATDAQSAFNPDGSACRRVKVIGPPAINGKMK